MPLVRRDPPSPAPAARSATETAAALRDPDPGRRREAVHALAEARNDPAALAAALATERDPRVREALVSALIRIGDAGVLLPFLRSEDASLRGAAITALQDLPNQVLPHMPA